MMLEVQRHAPGHCLVGVIDISYRKVIHKSSLCTHSQMVWLWTIHSNRIKQTQQLFIGIVSTQLIHKKQGYSAALP